LLPPILTMMHLRIMPCTYWTSLMAIDLLSYVQFDKETGLCQFDGLQDMNPDHRGEKQTS